MEKGAGFWAKKKKLQQDGPAKGKTSFVFPIVDGEGAGVWGRKKKSFSKVVRTSFVFSMNASRFPLMTEKGAGGGEASARCAINCACK